MDEQRRPTVCLPTVRRLPIGQTYNLRDVGGYPVTGGGDRLAPALPL
jgi:hypothetical protein